MDINTGRLISLGIVYLFMLVSGVILTKIGRPLNTAIFTVHKLIAIFALVLLLVTVFKNKPTIGFSAFFIAMLVMVIIAFIGEVATGGMLSLDKFADTYILTLHRILPAFIIILSALIVFWPFTGKG